LLHGVLLLRRVIWVEQPCLVMRGGAVPLTVKMPQNYFFIYFGSLWCRV